jgi:hypothetical protein
MATTSKPMRLHRMREVLIAAPLRPHGRTDTGRTGLIGERPVWSYSRAVSSSVRARSPGLVPTAPSREAAAGKGAAWARM